MDFGVTFSGPEKKVKMPIYLCFFLNKLVKTSASLEPLIGLLAVVVCKLRQKNDIFGKI